MKERHEWWEKAYKYDCVERSKEKKRGGGQNQRIKQIQRSVDFRYQTSGLWR